MLKQFKYKEVTWIDLESPTAEEIAKLGRDYQLHPVVLGELEHPSARSKVEAYTDFVYLTLHFPRSLLGHPSRPTSTERDYLEIDFILGKDVIITTHYELVNALNDFSKIFETDFILKKNHDRIHAGHVFYYIVKEIYRSLELGLGYLNDRLRAVGKEIFSGHELAVVQTLSTINHELLDARWALNNHGEIFRSLEVIGEELYGAKFNYYLRAISGEHERTWNMIENNQATFLDLRQTNDSLLSIKSNEVVKVLTVVAFVFLPLNLIAQIFSATVLPGVDNPNADFSIMIILMVLALAISLWLVKKRRWL